MPLSLVSKRQLVCASILFWPTAVLPQVVTDDELDALCTRFGELAYQTAAKREAGEDLEGVNAMIVQVMSDAADGKVNKSVARKMVASVALAQQPESGSKEEVAQWVYENCMTTDWVEAD
jgi:hypothetical protein